MIEADGTMAWFQHGSPHRPDGPAYISSNATVAWFYEGADITDDVDAWIAALALPPWTDWTDEIRVMFLLRFA